MHPYLLSQFLLTSILFLNYNDAAIQNILLEGDSWDFSCSDVNVQAVTKAIMKNGKPLPTNTQKYVFTPKGVTIKNLTPADSGSYKCQRAPKPMTWTFNVDVKPKGSGSGTQIEGQDHTIPCGANSKKRTKNAWTKNGKLLPVNRKKYVINNHNSLQIKNLTKQDSGTYACKTLEQQNWISTDIIVTKRIGPGGMARLPIANSTKVPK